MIDFINGQGYDSADLLIVADYARKIDAASGKCISGYYYQKFVEYFRPTKYSLDQCYRTCVIKTYIKGLGVGTFKQDKKILEVCFEEHELESQSFYISTLIDEINTIKPRYILAVGEYAMRILAAKEGLSKWRGSVLPPAVDIISRLDYTGMNSLRIIPTYHPYETHQQEELAFLIKLDIKKVVDLLFSE